MTTSSIASSTAGPARRPWVLLAAAALLPIALLLHGPIAQWADYHRFADDRSWLGLPNAANVLSNGPFLVVGAWALWRWRGHGDGAALLVWRCFALALTATAFGSAAYHWAPGDAALVGDRLPIALACAALSCAFLAERVDARWGRPGPVAVAMALAVASVAAWWATGDLRAYLCVQFLPMLLVPLGLALRLTARPSAVTDSAWWGVLAAYGVAKLFELADASVFAVLGGLSGHTLKHLVAAAGAAWLLRAAMRANADVPRRQLR